MPGLAIMADRNFGMDDDVCLGDESYKFTSNVVWEIPHTGANATDSPFDSNSANHGYEGQNVLFVDGHVIWANTPTCGLNADNIYYWDQTWGQAGTPMTDLWKVDCGVRLETTDSYLTLMETGYLPPVAS
jgi:prepilin-type processing-associated H-X9-DG protein